MARGNGVAAERVTTEIREGIAYVTLSRPDKMNALDLPMFEAIAAAGKALRRKRDVRGVILAGAGPAFCTGLDVVGAMKQPLKALGHFVPSPTRGTNLYQEVSWCWRRLAVPVIAVLHGRCYGGGLQIALGADFRIATPDCELSVMETKWGLVPDMTGSVTLRELLPQDVAKRLAMTACTFSGTQALAMNLVTEVAADPQAAALALARELMARSPDAVAGVKALIDRTWMLSPKRAFAVERAIQRRMFATENRGIAAKANAAREKPQFKDRRFGD